MQEGAWDGGDAFNDVAGQGLSVQGAEVQQLRRGLELYGFLHSSLGSKGSGKGPGRPGILLEFY